VTTTRPEPDGSGYLLYHTVGQYPAKASDMREALAAFAHVWSRADDGQWPYALGIRHRYIDRWREIVNAPPGTLTTAENVTAALYMLLSSLPAKLLKGRRILVAQDCFPSLHFMLNGLQQRLDFRLDTVPLRQGASWVEDEDMIARWGSDVALALITWVSSTSSHRTDVPTLVAHARSMGSIVGVDITQAAGLLPFDCQDPAVDFTVSTSLKWMCGSPGAGILQVAQPLIDQCEPALRGWFSQPDPFNWALDRFSLAPDARRFDNGTPSIMACAASLPALDWHAQQDHAALLAHNRKLGARIQEAITGLGLTLASPASPEHRGGSLMVRMAAHHGAAAAVDQLKSRQVFVDARGQTLRLSPGIMTTEAGVDRLIAALSAFR
jgi:selenocysteine lyase/cysteine desulfurase